MSLFKAAIAGLSLVAQSVFFVGFGFMVYDLLTFPDELMARAQHETSLVAPYIEETIASYRSVLSIGFIGALVSWILMLKGIFQAAWFLRASRILGWIWMPFFPLGTLMGVLLLSSRSAALEEQANT